MYSQRSGCDGYDGYDGYDGFWCARVLGVMVVTVFDVLGYSFTPLSRYPVIRVHGSCYFWLLQQGGGVAVSGMSVTRLSRDT